MARNGSGTYSLPAGNPVVTGTAIQSTWANTTLSDIATAITGSIAADGQTPITANLPMAGFKLTGLGAGSVPGDSVRYEQFASPPAIGGTTPAAGTFTTLGGTTITASTQFTGPGTGLTGTAASLSIGGSAASATSATTAGYAPEAQTITVTMAANAVTIAALNSMPLEFRSATATSGATSTVNTPSANLVIPSGATLGTTSAVQSTIVVVEMNNAGTREFAVANISGGLQMDETNLISTTAISAAATSASVWYSTSSRSSLPYRVIATFTSTQATAGTWATSASAVQSAFGNSYKSIALSSMVRLNTNGATTAGYGSTNTAIRRFTNVVTNQGSDITYADSATLGASFTINTSGVYAISHSDSYATTGQASGISLNSTQLSTTIHSITAADCLAYGTNNATNTAVFSSWSGYLPAGSIIRPHGAAAASTGTTASQFTIARIA